MLLKRAAGVDASQYRKSAHLNQGNVLAQCQGFARLSDPTIAPPELVFGIITALNAVTTHKDTNGGAIAGSVVSVTKYVLMVLFTLSSLDVRGGNSSEIPVSHSFNEKFRPDMILGLVLRFARWTDRNVLWCCHVNMLIHTRNIASPTTFGEYGLDRWKER